ncbi:MAG: TIM barrel protein [Candidatus Micrarchaeota archaeon]
MKLFIGPAGDCIATKGRGAAASFAHLKALGLNAQELEFVQQVYLTREAAAAVGREAAALGVRLSVHAPYFINLCSEEAAKVAASRKRISDSLDRCQALGAQGPVVVHAGFFQTRSKKECFDAVVQHCGELADAFPRAKLGLETTGKHSAFGNLAEVLESCKATGRKNVVPVVDFAHLYARNMGKIDYGAVLDECLSFNHRELHCHYSGINYGSKGELNHLPISANSPSFAPLASALKAREAKFAVVSIVCESPLLEADGVRMKKLAEKEGLTLS